MLKIKKEDITKFTKEELSDIERVIFEIGSLEQYLINIYGITLDDLMNRYVETVVRKP